ncbi:MAG: hypothetical protein ACSHYF_11405 [Verrucomicrobiaceae bacterium]
MTKFLRIKAASLLLSALTILSARAELPTFEEGVWMGYFAYNNGKELQVKVSHEGDITASPIVKNGEIRPYLRIPYRFTVRQKLPNGILRPLKVDPKSLKSESAVTSKLRSVVITGEAAGGVTFEMTIEFSRDIVRLGGRVTGTGKLKNPVNFHYHARLNHFHGNLLERLNNDRKKFDEIVGKDWLELYRLDKKKEKRHLTDVFELEGAEALNGPGSSKVEIQASIVDKDKRMLIFEAGEGSAITFSKRKSGPIHEGYFLDWTSDQTKDKEGKARFTLEIDEL